MSKVVAVAITGLGAVSVATGGYYFLKNGGS